MCLYNEGKDHFVSRGYTTRSTTGKSCSGTERAGPPELDLSSRISRWSRLIPTTTIIHPTAAIVSRLWLQRYIRTGEAVQGTPSLGDGAILKMHLDH